MNDLISSIDHLVDLIRETDGSPGSVHQPELSKLDGILANSKQLNGDPKFKENVLDYLAGLLLDTRYSSLVASSCSAVVLDLITRLNSTNNCDRVQLFFVLSEFICLFPEISEFVYLNFGQNFDPFSFLEAQSPSRSSKERSGNDHRQPNKRIKIDPDNSPGSLVKTLNACLNFFHFNSSWFISTWNWSGLFSYLDDNKSDEIRFLIYQCLRVIFNLSDELFYRRLNGEFDQSSLIDLRLKYNTIFQNKQISVPNKCAPKAINETSSVKAECSSDIVSIGGVLLKRINSCDLPSNLNKFVLFDSFRAKLQKLALAVRLDQPVLIEGPVGCCKTSLVECLANYVGRVKSPEILKLQMGDQIDRKVLIGSYHCTEIPGQFVWKAGPFTQALTAGNWIVLEDIDLAPNELINDIVTIIKTKSLDSISGCSFIGGKVHSSFRMFFTRRLVAGHSETYRLTDHEVIYKLCERIEFQQPAREELRELIKSKWPSLSTFADKLIDIYDLVQTSQLTTRSNRRITLRDLIKLCNRISLTFNNRSKEAFTLLLDTSDCFIAYLNGSARKLELCKQIGVLFNFTGEQVSAIYFKRKPVVEISDGQFKVGRYTLSINENRHFRESSTIFAFNLQSLVLLEQVAASIVHSESVLLIGETGVGECFV